MQDAKPVFTKEEQQRKLEDDFNTYVAMAPMIIAYAIEQAKVTHGKYNALVSAGFTEVQALELCTKI